MFFDTLYIEIVHRAFEPLEIEFVAYTAEGHGFAAVENIDGVDGEFLVGERLTAGAADRDIKVKFSGAVDFEESIALCKGFTCQLNIKCPSRILKSGRARQSACAMKPLRRMRWQRIKPRMSRSCGG